MILRGKVGGMLRRLYRAARLRELSRGGVSRGSGIETMWGYGLKMGYPDRRIWMGQFRDIVCRDCYGVHDLPRVCRVIDGGGNVGTFSLFLKWARPEAEVTVVEPSSANQQYLRSNLAQAPSGVQNLQKALWSSAGRTRLSGSDSDALRVSEDAGETVETVILQDLVNPPVDLLKLDIEGAELDVLRAGRNALRDVGRVVVEFHRYRQGGATLAGVVEVLESAGFDQVRVYDGRRIVSEDETVPVYCCLVEGCRS